MIMINDDIMIMNNNGSRLPTMMMTMVATVTSSGDTTIGMMPMMPPTMVPMRKDRT